MFKAPKIKVPQRTDFKNINPIKNTENLNKKNKDSIKKLDDARSQMKTLKLKNTNNLKGLSGGWLIITGKGHTISKWEDRTVDIAQSGEQS